jgi:tape measure domain-containing protein
LPVKLPDIRQKVQVVDAYKKPLAAIRRDVAKTQKFFKNLRDEIKRSSDPKAMKNLKASIKQVKQAARGIGDGFRESFRRTGVVIAGATAGIVGLGLGVRKVATAFSMVEDAEAAFTPLMGSAKKAKELVAALNNTAASTPFQFETLADTAKQLLPSMNGNIEKTIELTRMLGDTAGGNAQKMESITRGYNKALLKGKVDLEALNMIAEAGVPIFQQLGAQVGKSGKALFKDISAGRVSVEDLTGTFSRMTKQGGIFFKGMQIASKTLSGQLSTLRDVWTLALADMGKELAPVLKDVIGQLQGLIKHYKPQMVEFAKWFAQMIPKAIKKMVKMFRTLREKLAPIFEWIGRVINSIGWEKSALIGLAAFVGGPLIGSLGNLIPMIKGVAGAFKAGIPLVRAFGAALFGAGGPVGLIIMGVLALVGVIIYFRKELAPIFQMYKEGLQPLFRDWRRMIDELKGAWNDMSTSLGLSVPLWNEMIQIWIKSVGWFAKLYAMIVTAPLRLLVNQVLYAAKAFRFLLGMLKSIWGFVKKQLAPQLDWLGKKFNAIGNKINWVIGKLKTAFGWAKKSLQAAGKALGIAPEGKTAQLEEKDLGPGGGTGRRTMSGRQLTEQISELGDPNYKPPTLAEKVEKRGGTAATSVEDLLKITGGGGKGGKDERHITIDFKNMPKGVNVESTGDAPVDMNTGHAFDGGF